MRYARVRDQVPQICEQGLWPGLGSGGRCQRGQVWPGLGSGSVLMLGTVSILAPSIHQSRITVTDYSQGLQPRINIRPVCIVSPSMHQLACEHERGPPVRVRVRVRV